jgi:hypothetical protein
MPGQARLDAPGTLHRGMIRGIEGELNSPVKLQYLHGIILSVKESLTERFSQSMLAKVQNCRPNRLPEPLTISLSAVRPQGQSNHHPREGLP